MKSGAGIAAQVYAVLIAYASLYPFSGWHDRGVPLTDFLFAPWPRYWTVFDLLTNIAGYAPLGFLCVGALQLRLSRPAAAFVAVAVGTSLSLSMETIQNFLPSRVSSNVDLGCNAMGTLLGALAGVRWGRSLLHGGALHSLRSRLIVSGNAGDYGLILLAFWLLAQLNPEILLFGTGDLRRLFDLPGSLPFSAERFTLLEAAIAAAGMIAAGLIAAMVLRAQRLLPLLSLLLATVAVRVLGAAVLVGPGEYGHWLTPGNAAGVAFGGLAVIAACFLSRRGQRAIASTALLLATALVNLAPQNPYLNDMQQNWQQGSFLNFNGLTRLVSYLWPFLALPWLMLSAPLRRFNAPRGEK
jgi:VanZ family protein